MTELPAGSDVCKLVGLGFLGACRRRPATAHKRQPKEANFSKKFGREGRLS